MKKQKRTEAIFWMLSLCFGVVLTGAGIFYACTKDAVLAGKWRQTVKTMAQIQENDSVQTEKKRVALTFDDGPNPIYTEQLLAGLKERNVRASFFLLGEEAKQYPKIVKEIQQDGHLIGTHSYEHVNLESLGTQAACDQICRTNNLLEKLTGQYPAYIRPPYGNSQEEAEKRFSMVEVLWDVDTRDWAVQDTSAIVQTVEQNVKDGDIILMHDAYATSVQAAFKIVDLLKNDYEFVTVDQLILE
ncbi:MAG: polysaccharide deacetylase family protein [Lachnospiraceae bacterium]